MENERNPYEAPLAAILEAKPSRGSRVLKLFVVAFLGVCVGSYISAELVHFHYPDEARKNSIVLSHTVGGVLSSPLSMSFGVLPTLGFYGRHGWLVVPGFLLAVTGVVQFWRRSSWGYLVLVWIGFVLWAHNNFLGISALMSV